MLVISFLLPAKLALVLWPGSDGAGLWKVVSVMSGGITFVALYVLYMYFSLLVTHRKIQPAQGSNP
ncbi:hypothetical protein [Roseovarius aestuariivivens]|uniref:hypothetical protein n=1 Tax=Roseovarius aestuariivivens TaxID=1888910 RepID=UPI00108122F1|nr:hypothetical protein [Roseovarius aestuariivivens]